MTINTKFNIGDYVRVMTHDGRPTEHAGRVGRFSLDEAGVKAAVERYDDDGKLFTAYIEEKFLVKISLLPPDPYSPWTREHDRWIAEKVEGLLLVNDRAFDAGAGEWKALPSYNTDLPAILRAYQAAHRKNCRAAYSMTEGLSRPFTTGSPFFCGEKGLAEALARAALKWALAQESAANSPRG